jgi:hypothetical protein
LNPSNVLQYQELIHLDDAVFHLKEQIHACKDAVITLNLVKNFNLNQGVDSDIFFIVKKNVILWNQI